MIPVFLPYPISHQSKENSPSLHCFASSGKVLFHIMQLPRLHQPNKGKKRSPKLCKAALRGNALPAVITHTTDIFLLSAEISALQG